MTQDKHSQFTQAILEEVTSGDVSQKSTQYFIVQRVSLWLLAVVVTILGAISFAVLFAALSDLRGTLYVLEQSEVGEVLLLLPYVWILLGGLLVWYAYRRVRATDHGYRYSLWLIAATVISLSIVGGGLLYTAGFAGRADHFFAEHVPLYDRIGNPQHRIWRDAEQGILAGKIINVSEDTIAIRDITGRIWNVSASTLENPEVGGIVRIIGTPIATSSVEARAILRRGMMLPKEQLERVLQERREHMSTMMIE